MALLCLLVELREELGIVLSVAHVNHKLRDNESDEDERFVAQLAQQRGLDLHLRRAPVDWRDSSRNNGGKTTGAGSGIEARARELRYGFFRELAHDGCVTKIATAHTLDDQAETILLRIFRGTGIRGLAGVHPRIIFQEKERAFGEVMRPLLGFRRAALQGFLRECSQNWREDSSNRNIAFLRNRVRHRLLPLIVDEFGETAIEHMSELAEIARAEEEHWTSDHPEVGAPSPSAPKAASDRAVVAVRLKPRPFKAESKVGISSPDEPQPGAFLPSGTRPTASLPLPPLLAWDLAAQRRVLRAWLEANAPEVSISFRLIDEALELVGTSPCERSPGKKLELTRGWSLRLARQGRGREVYLLLEMLHRHGGQAEQLQGPDYQYALAVPGAVEVPELLARIEAQVVDAGRVPDDERAQLLDMARVPTEVLIRNWRAGDRYWPAHTAAAKKVKELLSDRHATGTQKKMWPVAVAEGCGLVWMRGFAVPASFRAAPDATKAIWIRELRA